MTLPYRLLDPWLMYGLNESLLQVKVEISEGVPKDLSGDEWFCHWRHDNKALGYVVVEVDDSEASEGLLTLRINEEGMAMIQPTGVFDIRGRLSGAIITGKTEWEPGVTRDLPEP